MIEIVTLKDKHRWDEIIRSMNNYDFYHLSAYHNLDKTGKPLLLYFRKDSDEFAFPFLLRDIPETDYKDITSVYGYAGPLSKNRQPSSSNINLFQDKLKDYFEENNVVTVFSRLHPFIKNQALLLKGLKNIVNVSYTVAINLSLSESEQRLQFTHSLKSAIHAAERKGITIRKAHTKKDIDTFVSIYIENMKRVHASKEYFFSKEYFYSFLNEIDSFLMLAELDGEIICGALCTTYNGIIQAHLAATKESFLKISPLKAIWNQVRLLGNEKKMKYFHLGGGFGGENDSLLKFKSHFSKELFTFQVWKYIHNEKIYQELNEKKFGNQLPDSSFFPLYRK